VFTKSQISSKSFGSSKIVVKIITSSQDSISFNFWLILLKSFWILVNSTQEIQPFKISIINLKSSKFQEYLAKYKVNSKNFSQIKIFDKLVFSIN
jgi:hypothetical protein